MPYFHVYKTKIAMKRISIALLLSFTVTISFAQIQRNAPLPGNSTTSDSTQTNKPTFREQIQALNLTKDQKIQIRQIRQDSKANRETIMTNDSLTQDQKQMLLKALRKQTATSFNAVLTNDQREKWQAMRAERKNNKNNQQENEAMEEEIMSLPAN
jgi:hypothetical protein